MKQPKSCVTQVGDQAAALARWNELVSKGPAILKVPDFLEHGSIVFMCANLVETHHTIALNHFNEKNIKDVTIPEMADRLRDRHAGIFYIKSINGDFDFQIYFVFNKEQTAVECIICVECKIGMIYFLDDFSILPTVLNKFMALDQFLPKFSDN